MDRRFDDELYLRACALVYRTGRVSVPAIQREFCVGFTIASRWVQRTQVNGIITIAEDQPN